MRSAITTTNIPVRERESCSADAAASMARTATWARRCPQTRGRARAIRMHGTAKVNFHGLSQLTPFEATDSSTPTPNPRVIICVPMTERIQSSAIAVTTTPRRRIEFAVVIRALVAFHPRANSVSTIPFVIAKTATVRMAGANRYWRSAPRLTGSSRVQIAAPSGMSNGSRNRCADSMAMAKAISASMVKGVRQSDDVLSLDDVCARTMVTEERDEHRPARSRGSRRSVSRRSERCP